LLKIQPHRNYAVFSYTFFPLTVAEQLLITTEILPNSTLTKKNFGRSLWRQPEWNESQQRQKNARNNKNDHVEDWNALHDDSEGQVWKRFFAARVSFDVLLGRTTKQLSLVTAARWKSSNYGEGQTSEG